jgi:ribonuclease HI
MGSVDSDQDIREVVLLEQLLLDPMVRASPERLRRLLHPDFREHGSSGLVRDRAGTIAALGEDPGVPGVATDFSPCGLAADVVLLTYRIVGSRPSLRSSVWVRDAEAGWQVRFHQGTRLPAD